MQVTGIQPIRHGNHVDIEVTFDDGTKCLCTVNAPPSAIPIGIVTTEGLLSPEMQRLGAAAAETWISENQAAIDEILAR